MLRSKWNTAAPRLRASCLLFSLWLLAFVAWGQTAPAPFVRLHYGAPFPYREGVGVELETYRAVRRRQQLADAVIASKNRLHDSLTAVLHGEHQLRVLADSATAQARAEAARQARAFDQLSRTCDAAVAAASKGRPLIARPGFWISFAAGMLGGVVLLK